MKKKLLGLALILIGLVIGADKLDIINIENIFFDGWWTLFIIIPCIFGIFDREKSPLAIFGLLIGLGMLAEEQELIESFGSLILPILLLTVGITVLFSKDRKVNVAKIDDDYLSVFGDVDKVVEKVEDINPAAIFGNLELDLSNLKLDRDIVINTRAVFGRVELKLPEDARLNLNKGLTLLGSCESKYVSSAKVKVHTITVNAKTVLGATEIE